MKVSMRCIIGEHILGIFERIIEFSGEDKGV
jgi:hypothetical protein